MWIEALLLGLLAGLLGVEMFNGIFNIHRPIVTGLLVGLILGDVQTGLITGAALELIWIGAVPVGGAQPPNVVVGGIIGTAFAIITKQDPKVSIGIAVPFAVAVQAGITLLFTAFAAVMHKGDKYAEEANTKGIDRINYLGMGILFSFYFIVTFLPIALGADAAKSIVEMMPTWLTGGLGVAGGMMPAIGFAMLLKIMYRKEYAIFLVIGFVLTTFLKLPIIALAALALCVAIYDYQINKKVDEKAVAVGEEVFSDGI